jgi:hypothetical protein
MYLNGNTVNIFRRLNAPVIHRRGQDWRSPTSPDGTVEYIEGLKFLVDISDSESDNETPLEKSGKSS